LIAVRRSLSAGLPIAPPSVSRLAVSGNCALRRRRPGPVADTLAIAAPRQLAHRCAIDFTLKTQEIFVITDVSWRFS
jgi:hypothetical protein